MKRFREFLASVDEWWDKVKADVREYDRVKGVGGMNVSEQTRDIAKVGFDQTKRLQEDSSLIKSKKS